MEKHDNETKNKSLIFRVEAVSALAGFHEDPLSRTSWNLKMPRLTVTNNDMTPASTNSRSQQTQ